MVRKYSFNRKRQALSPGRNAMNFVEVWFSGLVRPSRAFDELRFKPAPLWGFLAVLIRFVITSLTTILALYLLDREPFTPSNLTFLTAENYYAAEIVFLPLFGVAVWLLGSAVVYVILRLTGKQSDFDQILNIIGLGMLIPMPIVWLWDWAMIALNCYRMPVMAVSHSFFALWGVLVHSIGFKRILGLETPASLGLASTIPAVYIPLAMIFVR